MTSKDTFTVIDYVIFLSLIFLSALIGIYFIWKSRKGQTVDSYTLGNRKFKVNFEIIIIYFYSVVDRNSKSRFSLLR